LSFILIFNILRYKFRIKNWNEQIYLLIFFNFVEGEAGGEGDFVVGHLANGFEGAGDGKVLGS